MVSYYKNQKLYTQKVVQIEKLDKRENGLDAKKFHSEVFRTDAEQYFDKVEVISAPNNAYNVTMIFKKEALTKFHTFLSNISLNYKVSIDDNIIYEEVDKAMKVNIVVKPF
jgi:hypothetical protein